MTNQVNAAIETAIRANVPGSTLYNLASQYKHWIAEAARESEAARLSEINKAYNAFKKHGIIKE